tara:strand:- start:1129 stop:1302 length:174 start_codon:yes stop_codon:yes gene_type:complete
MTNENQKIGMIKELFLFLNKNVFIRRAFFIGISLAIVILSIGIAIDAPNIILAIKCK